MSNKISLEDYLTYVEKRIRTPLEGRGRHQSVGLTQIIGTHGTKIETVVDLAHEGRFVGENQDLKGKFHITPNLRYMGWQKTPFDTEIAKIQSQIGLCNPLDISREYASTTVPTSSNEDQPDEDLSAGGVVIAFSAKALDLVERVDMDEDSQEPEVVLSTAPPIESVRAIYPVDELASRAIFCAFENMR